MGYGEAPWVFKGRALYQLSLVKSEEARKHIPDSFKLVEAFGYTLGGFYLARYDDSPVGSFDELVALAGLVWNPPTSCAWAARVFVNDREARDHGRKSVGLPSQLASFQLAPAGPSPKAARPGRRSWWHQQQRGSDASPSACSDRLHIANVNNARRPTPVVSITLPHARPSGAWAGPRITLALPSFSGATQDCPALLQYSCDLRTNVSPVSPAAVVVAAGQEASGRTAAATTAGAGRGPIGDAELLADILSGRPLVALSFDDMVMTVEEPMRLQLPVERLEDDIPRPAGRQRGLLFGAVPPPSTA